MEEVMILLLAILVNAFEAVYEGLSDDGKKLISGILEFIHKILFALTIAYITYGVVTYDILIPVWKIALGYVFIRFFFFDLIYNLTRGLKWNYYGTTKLYDRIMTNLASWGFWLKILAGIFGTILLLGIN